MEIVVDTTEQQDITRNVFVKHILGLFCLLYMNKKERKSAFYKTLYLTIYSICCGCREQYFKNVKLSYCICLIKK